MRFLAERLRVSLERTVLEYLEQTARRLPEGIAFADEERELSFRELVLRAKGIGSALLCQNGLTTRPVAVLTGRTVYSVEGYMGALYAGCCYVPVDAAMPPQRMMDILEQIQPAALLYGPKEEKALGKITVNCPVLEIGEAAAHPLVTDLLDTVRSRCLDVDPAYMIFTSGSTGKPKGILISHRSVMDFAQWYEDITGVTHEDRLGNQAPFFFDLSVKDLYLTLKTGATTYILPKKCFLFPKLLVELLNEKKITTLSWATAAFHMTANSGVLEKYQPLYLKRVLLGGEALQAKQLNIWRRALPDVQYTNLYGPTEVTVDCTWYPIKREFTDQEPIPIGKACANKEVLLLNEEDRLCTVGEPGEICVRGSGLAIGYYGDGEKTECAFVQNPLNPLYPDRMYRTGDIGMLTETGDILFLSRKDSQIKHMGYRIELGEIETALNAIPGIRAAVCLFHKEQDKILAVYEGEMAAAELAKGLMTALPKYMLPSDYHAVKALPRLPNGKLDRSRLKEEYLC